MQSLEAALQGYRLVVDEQFDGDELDDARWLPYYLPQWAGIERSRARYRLTGDSLELFIAEDQPVWLPEVEPVMRVSSLQTGSFSGPVGSIVGQHRTDERMRVVEAQPVRRLLTPRFGAVELRARWTPHPDYMVALWMIGFEEQPGESAEICICEIFGSEASGDTALVGCGLHAFGDPLIVEDFDKVDVAIDIRQFHTYTALWTPDYVTFFVDGDAIRHTDRAPQYPMQLMLNIYYLGDSANPPPAEPFVVDYVRIYEPPSSP